MWYFGSHEPLLQVRRMWSCTYWSKLEGVRQDDPLLWLPFERLPDQLGSLQDHDLQCLGSGSFEKPSQGTSSEAGCGTSSGCARFADSGMVKWPPDLSGSFAYQVHWSIPRVSEDSGLEETLWLGASSTLEFRQRISAQCSGPGRWTLWFPSWFRTDASWHSSLHWASSNCRQWFHFSEAGVWTKVKF